jgi:hypothetical protein
MEAGSMWDAVAPVALFCFWRHCKSAAWAKRNAAANALPTEMLGRPNFPISCENASRFGSKSCSVFLRKMRQRNDRLDR